MKRLPAQPVERHEYQASHLKVFTAMFLLIPFLILAAISGLMPSPVRAQEKVARGKCPPPTRKDGTVETIHGVPVPDPYRWLEDQNSAETRSWIDAQDRCTDAALDSEPGRAQITKRLTELMKVDSFGPPIERNGSYFFRKRRSDQDLFVIYKRSGLRGSDEVLVDPHAMSADHSTSVNLMDVSHDGSLAAYNIRTGGQDEVTVHFLDTQTRKELPDQLPNANYFALTIQPDNHGVYYARTTPNGPRVYHHVMGLAAIRDTEIFGKGYGHEKMISTILSEDGRYLLIDLIYGTGSTRTEIYFQDVKNGGPVKPIVNDLDSVFNGEIEGGALFLSTNWRAPHWHVFRVDLQNPVRNSWKEIVPETDTAIDSIGLFGGKIFVQYVRNAASQVKMFDTDGKPAGEIAFPALGTVAENSGAWSLQNAFLDFQSFNVPDSIYRYDMRTGKLEAWAAPKVPLDSSGYTVEQVWYESKDKTRVPMFLFYKKDLKRDGARPIWLTGYGGFDVNNTPHFYEPAAEWADAGGIYAVAILRGGGEFGEAWHMAGMMQKKQTVFDDFISAEEWLIANGYTNSKKLAIIGGSNGGLLVGAALTQRPELEQAVVCLYPLLDMLRYQKFMDGPLWVPEYGSADDPAQFKYLYAYSPYHQVKQGVKYPAVLFITGDGDTRVAPLHARKMVARLQAATASDNPILLLYDTKSGHSGGRPLGKLIEERTNILSFLFSELGVSTN
jgi:prolyl oligopeptidase